MLYNVLVFCWEIFFLKLQQHLKKSSLKIKNNQYGIKYKNVGYTEN